LVKLHLPVQKGEGVVLYLIFIIILILK
jgi:hypothetical protein